MLRQRHALHRAAWFSIPLLLTLLLTNAPAPALAAFTRYVSPSGTDAGNCLSSVSRCRTFNYAISQSVAGDTIKAAPGVYKENVVVDKNLTLRGTSLSSTIIDPGAAGRVVTIQPNVTAKLVELTIRNGKVSSGGGAGILNNHHLTLTSVIVSGNQATGGYGGES